MDALPTHIASRLQARCASTSVAATGVTTRGRKSGIKKATGSGRRGGRGGGPVLAKFQLTEKGPNKSSQQHRSTKTHVSLSKSKSSNNYKIDCDDSDDGRSSDSESDVDLDIADDVDDADTAMRESANLAAPSAAGVGRTRALVRKGPRENKLSTSKKDFPSALPAYRASSDGERQDSDDDGAGSARGVTRKRLCKPAMGRLQQGGLKAAVSHH